MWKIVIIMFLLDPTINDALEIDYLDGKVLEFEKRDHCYEHIYYNLEKLKSFAYSEFGPGTPVKSISCFKKFTGV
tara:strand:+ start:667 stop:891 length:225 start_codon:yes stop_codon:yes gene_type:complete